ncbi:4-oxalocrotonate tautomerase DmpI [Desulfosediminicola flagellatus]|uniref:4-oxalocrotonate tautomerase DmpI n=1 Tax=Desulfosediminicola flagellatus TaxID=2569541 RepID=UPI0010AD1FA8|nr:4-oxalocrotonate tautomerase DmpI [Desulfosediminicola flagellatus]
MPVITITMGKGQASKEQKKQIIEQFTTQAVEITRLPAQAFTILINELNADAIGVGGITLEEKYATS